MVMFTGTGCGRRVVAAGRVAAVLTVVLTAGGLSGCQVTFYATPPKAPSGATESAKKSAEKADKTSSNTKTTKTTKTEKTKKTRKTGKAAQKAAPSLTAPAGSALKALAGVEIKGRAAKTGYDRHEFGPAWSDTDRNGCDQRNDILRRDLTDETLKAGTHGCVVLAGTFTDPYTGERIEFRKAAASKVQIDHVVALENAWVSGASGWSDDKREQLATDPLNLLAAKGSVNQSKGSGDAATWLPPQKSFRCKYVARQVAVKVKYGASMTRAEHAAIEQVLYGCPDEKLPQAQTIPLGPG